MAKLTEEDRKMILGREYSPYDPDKEPRSALVEWLRAVLKGKSRDD
jgi:hypothetical protein